MKLTILRKMQKKVILHILAKNHTHNKFATKNHTHDEKTFKRSILKEHQYNSPFWFRFVIFPL